jgi:hypothetical protein
VVEGVHGLGDVEHQDHLGVLAFDAVPIGGKGGLFAQVNDAFAQVDGHCHNLQDR